MDTERALAGLTEGIEEKMRVNLEAQALPLGLPPLADNDLGAPGGGLTGPWHGQKTACRPYHAVRLAHGQHVANPVASPAPKQARSSVRRSAVKLELREAYGYAWRVDDDGAGALVFSTIANG